MRPVSIFNGIAEGLMLIAAALAVLGVKIEAPNILPLLKQEPTWQLARTKVEERLDSPWMTRIRTGETSISVLRHGPQNRPRLALTFDDGPHGKQTYELLKVLKENRVKATFFVVGQMTLNRKTMLTQMVAEGHEIANHSFSHPNLAQLDLLDILTEYKATQIAVENITGRQPRFCRPPGGRLDEKTLRAASALGLTTVYWNSNPGDYKFDDPQEILSRLRQTRANGDIILLHSGLPATVEAMRVFIPECQRMGFEFVLLDGWLGHDTSSLDQGYPQPRPASAIRADRQSVLML